jgi:hypothetical protein
MAGYILLDLEITDPEGFQEYLKLAGPTVKQYGGKVLVGGAVPENLEGDWHPRLFSKRAIGHCSLCCAGQNIDDNLGELRPFLFLEKMARTNNRCMELAFCAGYALLEDAV